MNDSLVNTPTVSTAGLIAASQVTLGDIDTAPEWIELLPAGVFSGRDGRGPYRVSDPEAVIAATRALGLETGIPIDYDHATDLAAPEGRPAPAAGWINELAVRNGTIWGRVEWTHHGAGAVTTHEYRYISPVFEHDRDGDVVRLVRAALTNNPNLTLTAISARASRSGDSSGRDADNTHLSELALQLCAVLNIAESSTSDEIIDVVRTLCQGGLTGESANRPNARTTVATELHPVAATSAHFVPVAQFQEAVTELNKLRASRASERADHAVTEAIRLGKLIPAQREWAIAYCVADFQGFEEFVARQPALALGEAEFNSSPTSRRQPSYQTPQSAGVLISQAEREICAILSIARDDFVSRKLERDGASPVAQLR